MSAQTGTLVTAFLSEINLRTDRSIGDYLRLGKELLDINVPKVVFIDKKYASLFLENRLTKIIPLSRSDIPLFNSINDIKNDLITDNPLKDTAEYIIFQCSKTEFVRRAIDLNPFSTAQFFWVDFGIKSIFSNSNLLKMAVAKMHISSHELVRIGNINSVDSALDDKIYRQICWKFAGGCFGGPAEKLREFALLVSKKCASLVSIKHALMWEVNVWAIIYQNCPELFSPYECDHNPNLLINY